MPFLHSFSEKKSPSKLALTKEELFSVYYHNIFDYPLSFSELVKWNSYEPPPVKCDVEYKNGFYFVKGRVGLVYKRIKRKRYSNIKIKIAKKASKILSFVPGVKMIGVTGSLAMENTNKDGDIDLIIITKHGCLWSTRFLVYILLIISHFKIRRPKDPRQKNRLCLNMWLDEANLSWTKKDRSFYTAHEILQTMPIFDKNHTYNSFLESNRWVLKYWPNVKNIKTRNSTSYTKLKELNIIEKLLYWVQYAYMKPKITREIVTPFKAIFHPTNLNTLLSKNWSLTRRRRIR